MSELVEFELEFRNQRYDSARAGLQALSQILSKDMDGMGQVLGLELKRFLKHTMQELADRHSTPWPRGTTPTTLSRRSGKAYLAIKNSWEVSGTRLETVQGIIRLPREVAVHEKGATVRPKKAKFLAIPLPAALRSNGTPIKPSPRQWQNTFVGESKKGNLLIFQKRGSKIVPLYALKKQVKIPPRLGLKSHVYERLPRFIDRAFEAMLDALVEQ